MQKRGDEEMAKKELATAGAISTVPYFSLPQYLTRLKLLAIIATVFVSVRTIAWMVDDLRQKRRETNYTCQELRRPAKTILFHGVGSEWPMLDEDGRII